MDSLDGQSESQFPVDSQLMQEFTDIFHNQLDTSDWLGNGELDLS